MFRPLFRLNNRIVAAMPVHIAAQGLFHGFGSIPFGWPILKAAAWLFLLWFLKTYFGGARNTAERNMHSKVIMITGGTSGIGASVAYALAARGAQLVLLTQQPLSDPFLADYIMDLRARTDNELITAEHVDLSSLHSIRVFATKWVDNAPPRRLDMVILCASTMTPKGGKVQVSPDGVELNFAINYLANFHLLSILSPALRAQPPDRDVRVIFGTCSSYMGGVLPEQIPTPKVPTAAETTSSSDKRKRQLVAGNPSLAYASSKLALMAFATAFQKHLSSYIRPDKQAMNTRVIMVDPGWSRTPGMRRFLTFGSLWGLGAYLALWPMWWLVLKSQEQGAQTFLWAAMEAEFGQGEGGRLLKECRDIAFFRDEVKDEAKQRKLWELSETAIQALEKKSAQSRAAARKTDGEKDGEATAKTAVTEKSPGSRRSRKTKA